jgi:hypothetical protein
MGVYREAPMLLHPPYRRTPVTATVVIETPLRLDIRPGDRIRFGSSYCLVCGRRAPIEEGRVRVLCFVRRQISRLQRWWHHRKCPPWTITEVKHNWIDGRLAKTDIKACGEPPHFGWLARLLGRPRMVSPQILAYTIERASR